MLTGLRRPPTLSHSVCSRGTAWRACTARQGRALDNAANCAKDAADHSSSGWRLQELPLQQGGAAAEAAAVAEPVPKAQHQFAEVPAEQRGAEIRAAAEAGPQQKPAAVQEPPAQQPSAAADGKASAGPGLDHGAPAEGGAPSASSALLQASLPGLVPLLTCFASLAQFISIPPVLALLPNPAGRLAALPARHHTCGLVGRCRAQSYTQAPLHCSASIERNVPAQDLGLEEQDARRVLHAALVAAADLPADMRWTGSTAPDASGTPAQQVRRRDAGFCP